MEILTNKKLEAEAMVREFILDDHPCVMAQSVVADDNLTVCSYDNMGEGAARILIEDLKDYLNDASTDSMKFQTFIAVFNESEFSTEKDFEIALWGLLNNLHKLDDSPWDARTSPDPQSPKFSFSLFSESFYIVGMHPNSSRWARSSPVPMIVFNLHSQFELLRKADRYTRVRDLIRRRDKAYQGSINPMLEDFGTHSEARQYSGRAVGKTWECPFKY
ncbi:guanitoxin biosynthesis heme-dependent pre-guanitoxin N-hydroxylase GntA [Zobellia alginiliquefaciens]|uniref:guanitoxin biosynthesis heme-dependent pre-guanitoxin N-hydroxylase GntA n=1 Tax=Zobellia alginiliquefaciens TaxID=3032586 RepID=UPI0023E470F0|nr:guanitoxin biosynthesis heme-dependent pre-guanitoxin N-hydroxylase GntA [Zobellia alginiliquefaciens]